jgi:PAS domain S-box-containing protein
MASLRKNAVRSPGWSADAFRVMRELLAKQAQAVGNSGSHTAAPDGILTLLEQLRIREIELEIQNAELRLAQADVKASRAHYLRLYDHAPVGYLTLDGHGVIIELNPRATELLGNRRKTVAVFNAAPEAIADASPDGQSTSAPLALPGNPRKAVAVFSAPPETTADASPDARPAAAHCAMLASNHGSPEGRSFYRLIATEDRDVYYLCRRRLLRTAAPQSCELRILQQDAPPFWARLEMSLGHESAAQLCYLVIVDIDETRLAELQVQESERQLRNQANALPEVVWASAPDGEIDYFNERWFEYTGATLEQAKKRGWQSAMHPDDLAAWSQASAGGFATGTPFELTCRLKQAPDGVYRWQMARCAPYRDREGNILRWFGSFSDIHEREVLKDRLASELFDRTSALEQSLANEDQLQRLLGEKDSLLNEVHLQMKNSLQAISSPLRMQSDALKDTEASAALKEGQHRVISMALIHERLNASRQPGQIDFAEYAQTLVNELFRFYARSAGQVVGRLEASRVRLNVNLAIPCGLILNELVTNALKYASLSGRSGEVVVELRETAEGVVTLSVSGRGIALAEGIDRRSYESSGLPIVDLLTRQIGGKLDIQWKPNTAFTIQFPKEGKMIHAAMAQL